MPSGPPSLVARARVVRPLLMLAGLVLAGLLAGGCQPAEGEAAREAAHEAARETAREAAVYVGDAACATCHAEIAETYAQTNHARAITDFDPATAPERIDGTVVHNAATNLSYEARVVADTLFVREFREDDAGRLLHERIHRADYVIGSGNATRSYLMRVNGYLTEMPLTWYMHGARWEMSPGYVEANDRFDRQISLECLTCHNGRATHSAFTQNHYPEIPLGITCERCHGPASAHVDAWQGRQSDSDAPSDASPAAPDPTIVNPARLDRGGRLSVCQQCHLAGVTVFQPGDDATTFRPGTPLSAHRTVFVPTTELTDEDAVGIDSHPIRLARSACYVASEMTCGTCHDPHRPEPLLAEDHYNNACLTCHDAGHETVCARPEAEDMAEAATGDCVSCHMQQGGTTNVPHVIFTDHWIRRDPGPARDPDAGRPALETPNPLRLAGLQEPGRSAAVLAPRRTRTPAADLEAATAYFTFYETMHRVDAYLDSVRVLARRGFRGGADHVEARIALARALAQRDSLDAATALLADAARAFPDHAWVAFWLGAFEADRGNASAAIDALGRAVTLQPNLIEAQVKLADALMAAGRRDEARARLETVVALDPVHRPKAWYNLGLLRLQAGLGPEAADAFAEAAHLDPDLVDAHIQYGSYHLAQKNLEAAAESFYRAIVAAPENPAGYGSLGLVFLQQNRPADARRLFERVLELDPTNANARALLERLR